MPLRLCLIGAGHMGRIHAQKLAGMKDVTLTCVIDTDPRQANETARAHGTVGATHYAQALEDGLQAAVIASPTETHYAVARLCSKTASTYSSKSPLRPIRPRHGN